MKKLMMILTIALMSVLMSVPASATTGNKKDVLALVPQNMIVKQTTTFTDGRTLTLYYKKEGAQCEVYSPCAAKDFSMDDVSKVKSTSFEVVQKTEGRLYKKATLKEMLNIVRKLVSQYS